MVARALFWILLTTSTVTSAQQAPANREEAKRIKDLGAAAFERGELQVALELYQHAYAVFPSPRLRFNLGMALAAVGRYPEAMDEYERFLTEAEDAPADARAHARQRLIELEARVARLTVTIEPAGATLLVDGRPTPLDRPLRLLAGGHEVGARLAGHQPASSTVEVAAGETRSVALRLRPLPPASSTILTAPPPTTTPGRPRAALWIGFSAAVVVAGVGLGVGLGLGLQSYPTEPSALGTYNVSFPR